MDQDTNHPAIATAITTSNNAGAVGEPVLTRPKRAVLYVVAPTPEAQDAQAAELTAFVRERGYVLGKTYRGETSARPVLHALRSDAKRGEFDVVVIITITALAPNGPKALSIALDLSKIGLGVESAHEPWFRPNGALAKYIVANEQRRQRKSKSAIAAKRANGEAVGNPPFGLCRGEDGMLEEDAGEQNLIERVLDLYAQNLSFGCVADIVTREGHLSRNGTPLTHVQIARILRRYGGSDG